MLPFSTFTGLQLFSVRALLVRELYMPSLISFCLVAVSGFLFYDLSPLESDFAPQSIVGVPDTA